MLVGHGVFWEFVFTLLLGCAMQFAADVGGTRQTLAHSFIVYYKVLFKVYCIAYT